MDDQTKYWCELYKKLKHEALCLDIETTGFNGSITLVGLYNPRDGLMEHTYFIRNKDLNTENLKKAFQNCKLLITYNGASFDVPRIKREFPGSIPEEVLNFDLYLLAKKLKLNTNLKVLETTLGIDRLHEESKKRHIAVNLWKKYAHGKNEKALLALIEYNKQDTINLYPLAEKLIERAYQENSPSK